MDAEERIPGCHEIADLRRHFNDAADTSGHVHESLDVASQHDAAFQAGHRGTAARSK